MYQTTTHHLGTRGRSGAKTLGLGLTAAAAFAIAAAAPAGVTLVESGHSANLIADSVNLQHPSQIMLGGNNFGGPGGNGIEGIAVDPNNRVIYVLMLDQYGACPSATTSVFSIDPVTGGLTSPIAIALPFGACERGTDIDLETTFGMIIVQNENPPTGPEIAWIPFAGGPTGTWSAPASFMNSTFGMQFAPGIGAIPAGEIVYVSDGPVLQLLSAPLGGSETAWAPLPGPGDDLYIQPDGDIVFISEAGGLITRFDPNTLMPTPSSLPPLDIMHMNDGLMPSVGTRATVCSNTGEGFVAFSGAPGGHGVYRLNEPLTAAHLMLTVNYPTEGIQDITVGPPTGVGLRPSLYVTVEDYNTGAHQVWEITNACPEKRLEPKWTQLPHGAEPVPGGPLVLYATTGNSAMPLAGDFLQLNTSTGAGTLVAQILSSGPLSSLDCDPASNVMYAGNGQGLANIFTIDPNASPPETYVGFVGTPSSINALEWVGPTLYGAQTFVGGGPTTSTLVTINPVTGLAMPIGLIGPGVVQIGGMAWDAQSGIMYGVEASVLGRLVTIDVNTGFVTSIVGSTGFSHVGALEFDPQTGILYGGLGSVDPLAPGALITINKFTGAGTFVGQTGWPGISGMTFCEGPLQGVNVPSNLNWNALIDGEGPNKVVADDFESDGRPITCIRWWGSYIDPAFGPGENQTAEVDGWLLSFHNDMPDPDPADPDTYSQPRDLLGLYYAPHFEVFIQPTEYVGWDGHAVYEYEIDLDETCLLHSYEDVDSGEFPAKWHCFAEEAGTIYWLDVQALVGQEFIFEPECATCDCDLNGDGNCDLADLALLTACFGMTPGPGCPDLNCDGIIDVADVVVWNCLFGGGDPETCCPTWGCLPQSTGQSTQQDFWGWHTSPDAFMDESVTGMTLMAGNEWFYDGWVRNNAEECQLPRVDQAFMLLTPSCPEDVNNDGTVDVDDLVAVILAWGPCVPIPCPEDTDCNGKVDVDDLVAVILAWGPCP